MTEDCRAAIATDRLLLQICASVEMPYSLDLLRTRRERPGRRAAEKRDELPAFQITASATAPIHASVSPPEEGRRRTVPCTAANTIVSRSLRQRRPASPAAR